MMSGCRMGPPWYVNAVVLSVACAAGPAKMLQQATNKNVTARTVVAFIW
jgi:hypothetical protein